jgi:hypothetical protein
MSDDVSDIVYRVSRAMRLVMADIAEARWIPEDIRRTSIHAEGDVSSGMASVCGAVASALIAERERIAKIAAGFPEVVHHPAGPAYGAGFAAAVQQLRIAIRRGDP